MKNRILVFIMCIAVFFGLFGVSVSADLTYAGSTYLEASNVHITEDAYVFSVHINAQSVSGYILVAGKGPGGVFSGVQVYDANENVDVEVSKDCASVTVFWWDICNAMKPMVRQLDVRFLNDIEDGGLL